VAKLLKQKQPKLFDYLLKMRDKKEIAKLVNLDNPQPFVYSSGRYPVGLNHTTVAYPLAPGGKPGAVIVYDLRHDPTDWARMTVAELKDIRFANYERRQMEGFVPLPAKELAYNKCPAVAPMGVLDATAQDRLKIDLKLVQQNLAKLLRTDLADKLAEVFVSGEFAVQTDVDAQLYNGFITDQDKPKMAATRSATAKDLVDFKPDFTDERLNELLVRYKARNFPQSLNESELAQWEKYKAERISRELPKYSQALSLLASQAKTTTSHFILQELQLWAESIAPVPE